jgi:hypothetical protein
MTESDDGSEFRELIRAEMTAAYQRELERLQDEFIYGPQPELYDPAFRQWIRDKLEENYQKSTDREIDRLLYGNWFSRPLGMLGLQGVSPLDHYIRSRSHAEAPDQGQAQDAPGPEGTDQEEGPP